MSRIYCGRQSGQPQPDFDAMTNAPLAALIRSEAETRGRLTFAEFMAMALYHPAGGYYTRAGRVGETGDFYTSPAAHPAFGALLCVQFWRMWRGLGRPARFTAVELGAGDGLLARDVCAYADRFSPDFAEALSYVAIDLRRPAAPSPTPDAVQSIVSDRLPLRGLTGCVIANELLDALPFHRFRVSGGELREVYVVPDHADGLCEELGEPSTPLLAERLQPLGVSLPDGFRGEICLELRPWLASVADALDQGYLITIDYGFPAGELYAPERMSGTLQTHYAHTVGNDPFARVGEQDITAHVDFTSVMSEGRAVGLEPVAFGPQAQFLRSLGFGQMLQRLSSMPLGDVERNANRMGMLDLVRRGGLGDFRVLLQRRGDFTSDGAEPDDAPPAPLDPPLLSAEHAHLMAGRYPHAAQGVSPELEHLWPFGAESDEDSRPATR